MPHGHPVGDPGCRCTCSIKGCTSDRYCKTVCYKHKQSRVENNSLAIDPRTNRLYQRDHPAALSIGFRFFTDLLGISYEGTLFAKNTTWVRDKSKRSKYHRSYKYVPLSDRIGWEELFTKAGIDFPIFHNPRKTEHKHTSKSHRKRERRTSRAVSALTISPPRVTTSRTN